MMNDTNAIANVYSMLSNGSTFKDVYAYAAKCAASQIDLSVPVVGVATVAPRGGK